MPIGVIFDKAKAEYFLDALKNGKPVRPQEGHGWTQADMIAMAGACHFAALTHSLAGARSPGWEGLPEEQQRAVEETVYRELAKAIEWCSHATMLVEDGEYDAAFAREHKAVIFSRNEGERKIQPVSGFKAAEQN
jgi:hypothetical protein